MQHVETQQRVFSHDVPTKQQEAYLVANEWHRGNDVSANGHCPKGELVPRQKIARVAEEQRDQKKHDTNHPVELMRRFVAPAVEHVKHVPEHGEDHQVRGEPVKISKEDAVRNLHRSEEHTSELQSPMYL